jgi:hypothetical protein
VYLCCARLRVCMCVCLCACAYGCVRACMFCACVAMGLHVCVRQTQLCHCASLFVLRDPVCTSPCVCMCMRLKQLYSSCCLYSWGPHHGLGQYACYHSHCGHLRSCIDLRERLREHAGLTAQEHIMLRRRCMCHGSTPNTQSCFRPSPPASAPWCHSFVLIANDMWPPGCWP